MKVIIAIRDIKADAFGNPMFVRSKGEAMRMFTDEVNRADQDNALYRHPEDFELYILGTYDDEKGDFQITPKEQITTGGSVAVRNDK